MKSEWSYYNSLPELLSAGAKKYQSKDAVGIANDFMYSYEELDQLACRVAVQLKGIDVSVKDKIALISENSPHWVGAYFGIMKAGGIVVPVLTDFSEHEMVSILEHSGSEVLYVSNKQLSRIKKILPDSIKHIISIENLEYHQASDLKLILEKPVEKPVKIKPPECKKTASEFPTLDKDDTAVIIYTSGTTGNSKGVMLSHDNLIFDAVNTASIHQVVASDVFLSVLPLAHSYESTIGMIIPLLNGSTIHYIDRLPTAAYLGPVLAKIKPTTMLTVPLIIEKIYKNSVQKKLMDSPVTKRLLKYGITRRVLHRAAGKKLMKFFGGRLRFFGIGGAAINPEVEKFLLEAKFPYAVGYGLTETSPMLSGFGPDAQVYRSIGTAIAGIELKVNNPDPETGEGEIIAKGRNIMKGYYKNPEQTKEVFTEDGFFRTGDLGTVDDNGIFYIKGRSKNMILGANGENIYPEEIESVINSQEYVADSLVMQVKGKLTALIHPNFDNLEAKIQHMKSNAHDKQVEIQSKAEEVIQDLKETVNKQLNKNSKIQKTVLQKDPFDKTPTKKIKRFLYKD